ncbi:PaaI family thioesterase [uncultured Alcanivorax sp.]|jgi:uncharacterized protein (TIGR00369 family)|uniref:PaaI family thioesterase n=1 Tax=uncultured Alcanivorax sp. TaxID=191215 RepID=UPI00259011A9|nr:PaaI family thioesterase [uncultured Alcanivorax sp.]
MTAVNSISKDLLAASGFFGASHPLFGAFGIEMEEVAPDGVVMGMPCVPDTCDSSGVLHRGAIATLMDTTCGLAIFIRLGDMRPIATIDLRVDFITMPGINEAIYCKVVCFAIEGDIAYVRGEAFGRSGDDVLASVSGSFAIGTLGPSFDKPIAKEKDNKKDVPKEQSGEAGSDIRNEAPPSHHALPDESPYSKFLGIWLGDDDGVKTYEMSFRDKHVGNPLIKTFHGGILASFAEIVAGSYLTSNNGINDKSICSSMTFDYLRPAFAGTLRAEPRIIREGRRFIIVVVDLFIEKNKVSQGRFIYKRALETI